MIHLEYVKDDFQIYSVSGRVEFIIFYNRIKYLVNFYNYTEESYLNLIEQKHRERKRIEDNVDEILSAAEEHDIDFTEEEAFIAIDEVISGIEMNFIEYQKMTLLIILFSEVEKLTDNLYDFEKNLKKVNKVDRVVQKIQNLCLAKKMNDEDIGQIIGAINELRKIRNRLVHEYDFFDDEIKVNGIRFKGIKQMNDDYLSSLVNRLTESILKLEEGYVANLN